MKDREFAAALLDRFCSNIDEALKEYIFNHPEDYFNSEFFEEFNSKTRWMVKDIVNLADYRFKYEKTHINDIVTLDTETREMLFNHHRVPAYWYRKGMPQKKIGENLNEYRRIWSLLGYPQTIQYPMMEYFRGLQEWRNEYRSNGDAFFPKIERDLECLDTDEAKALYNELSCGRPLHGLQNVYPWKIKKILKVDSFKENDSIKEADITLRLNDGSQCKVKVHAAMDGSYRGMTALGRRGFPWMTERDIKLIETEVFGKE